MAAVEVVDKAIAEVVGTAEVGTETAGRMTVELVVDRMDRRLADEASYPGRENVLRSSVEEVGCTVVVRLRRKQELHWDSSAEDIRNLTFWMY